MAKKMGLFFALIFCFLNISACSLVDYQTNTEESEINEIEEATRNSEVENTTEQAEQNETSKTEETTKKPEEENTTEQAKQNEASKKEKKNSSSKEKTNKKTKQESSKLPINIPKGYSRLQAFYLKCTEDKSIDELDSLAKKCGLYSNKLDYSDYNEYSMELEVSEKYIPYELYKGVYFEYECDHILVSYENRGNGFELLKSKYYFLDNDVTVVFEPNGLIYKDEKIVDDRYYTINNSIYDSSDRFYDAKEVMDAAIKASIKASK